MLQKTSLEELLDKLSLREKIFQLVQVCSGFFTEENSDITGPMEEMGLSAEDIFIVGSNLGVAKASTAVSIQKNYLKNSPNGIPMIFMRDVIHGFKTIYPIPIALGCSFDEELMEECSKMAAKEASAGGVHLTFTPMVDYVRDARWGRVMESCGEDPHLNSKMGAAQVKAFQGDDISNIDNIATCVKHFAAYGSAEAGRDYNTVEISERYLRQFHFPAYKACVDAGVKMLMTSFNSLNGIPSVANKWLMNDVLRKEWGYEGLVISDWGAVKELTFHTVATNLKEAARLAFESGCDIEMMSSAYGNHLEELINEGIFSREQLDEAVMKVLKLKDELGLFEDPYHGASEEREMQVCLCPEHRELARRSARESAVLLKNNGVLPLSKSIRNLAVIGPFADTGELIGSWAGSGKKEDTITVIEGIKNLLPNVRIKYSHGCTGELSGDGADGFGDAVAIARDSDAVILCLGEKQKYSGEGACRTNLELPGMQTELARQVINANPNCAVVLFTGRPLVLNELNEISPAILNMWFPGTEGGNAVADLIFGDANPCGKLTMSFPKSVGQCPIYYNYCSTGRPKRKPDGEYEPYMSNYLDCGNKPLYFFGEGLSYTKFVYDSMELSSDKLDNTSSVKVSVTVKNTGERKGKETVQLYLRDIVSETVRPVQELIAFKKIELNAGEIKCVEFEINEEMLRYWNFQNEFVSEKGEFEVFVGYADHKFLCGTFELV